MAGVVSAGQHGRHTPAPNRETYTGYQPYCSATMQSHMVEPGAQPEIIVSVPNATSMLNIDSEPSATSILDWGFT